MTTPAASHAELLKETVDFLESYLDMQIEQRQSHYLPPKHLCGPDKDAERRAYYRQSTNPGLIDLLSRIETALDEKFEDED